MPLSPEMSKWLSALAPAEVKALAEFGGLKSGKALADLGDDGLRALDARFRASLTEPAPPPADVPPPPSEPPSRPANNGPGEPPPSPPAPPSPEAAPDPAAPADARGEGGRSVSPGAPVAGDPRVSPVAPPSKPRLADGEAKNGKDPDGPAPGAPRGWMVRLREKRILEIGLNGEVAILNGKRFAGPFRAEFVEHLEREAADLGVTLEIEPAGR